MHNYDDKNKHPLTHEILEAVNLHPDPFWKSQLFKKYQKIVAYSGLSFLFVLGLFLTGQQLTRQHGELGIVVDDISSITISPPRQSSEALIGSEQTTPPEPTEGEEASTSLTVVSGDSHRVGEGVETAGATGASNSSSSSGGSGSSGSGGSDEEPADILEVQIQYADNVDRSNPSPLHGVSTNGSRAVFLKIVNLDNSVIKRVEWFIDGDYYEYEPGVLRNNDLYTEYDMKPNGGTKSGLIDLNDEFGTGVHIVLARLITETTDGSATGSAKAWADEEAVFTVTSLPTSGGGGGGGSDPPSTPDDDPDEPDTPTPPSGGGGSDGNELSLDPPSGWESYQKRTISSGGTYSLNDNTDYILDFQTAPDQRLRIRGGRNVVIMGGEININKSYGDNNDDRHMGIRFDDQTGLIHIEGLWIHGTYLSEGIQFNSPDADVQITNVRIDDLKGGQERPPYEHADIIQPWGGVASMKVDYLTGSSRYQGFMLKADYNKPNGPMEFSNVNIEMVEGPTADSNFPNNGGRYATWHSSDGNSSVLYGDNVYVNTNSQTAGGSLSARVWPEQSSEKSDGGNIYVDFSQSYISGRIYKGDPPGGDFVPSGLAGMDYER